MFKKVPVSVRLYPEEKAELAEIAVEEDQSVDRLARFVLRDWMKSRRERSGTKLEGKVAA
jgi:hypothetical protein